MLCDLWDDICTVCIYAAEVWVALTRGLPARPAAAAGDRRCPAPWPSQTIHVARKVLQIS